MRSQLQGTKNLAFRNRPGLRPVGQPTTWSHLCHSLHCTLLGEGEHQTGLSSQAASKRTLAGESLAASTEGREVCGSGLELLGILAPVALLSQKITLILSNYRMSEMENDSFTGLGLLGRPLLSLPPEAMLVSVICAAALGRVNVPDLCGCL